jgi:hypothetical protein
MPFVHRDANENILAIYTEFVEGTEQVAENDPALKTFVQQNIPSAAALDEWEQSDLALARVMEDLISILKVILFTDFPEGAQEKLRSRSGLRKQVSYVDDLFGTGGGGDDFGGGGGAVSYRWLTTLP